MPDRLFLRLILVRAAFFWLGVRLILYFVGVGGAGGASAVALRPDVAALVAIIVGFLGILEIRRRNESRFLSNLGVSFAMTLALAMAPAIVAEVAVGLVPAR